MITIEEMVSREIYYNVSGLVSDLVTLSNHCGQIMANETGFDPDELMELCQRPDYEAAADSYIDDMDRGELIEALEEANVEDLRSGDEIQAAENLITSAEGWNEEIDDIPKWLGVSDKDLRSFLMQALDEEVDGYKDFVESNSIDYDYQEVYEHWLVSEWLASQLRDRGEVVGDISNLTVWGRCTTGQSISMDHVIQETYKEMIR